MTLYTTAGRNKTNSWLLLTIFLFVTIGIGWLVSTIYNLPGFLYVVTVIALIQAYASYYYSDQIALAIAHAQPLPPSANPTLHHLVENLAITAGLPQPKLYLIDDSAPNAFATGRDPQHASIAVTSGLLAKLEKPELEGILAHELSHIGNYDIRFLSMVVVLVGVITMISDLVLRWTWWGGGRSRSNDEGGNILAIVGLVLIILSPLIAMLLQLAISRKREFLADSTGALLTRYPQGLASALRKIAADTEPLEVANKGTAPLYFANPLKGPNGQQSWLQKIFSTHPPVEERIRLLLAGGGAA